MNRYYIGWLAPLSFFESSVMLRQAKSQAQFPIYFNPMSLHLTFEEVMIPCKAVVDACDESAAWLLTEHAFAPTEIKRRFARLWDTRWQLELNQFIENHGFRLIDGWAKASTQGDG